MTKNDDDKTTSVDTFGTREKVGPRVKAVPEGDNRERMLCPDCGFIHYDNPKVVVGVVATWEERILLCRRNIHPRKGFWTIPAGYMELNETTEDGAKREAYEEARINVALNGILAVYNIPRISQVQVLYHGTLIDGSHEPGPESQETELFAWSDIPWDDLAFPSVHWVLGHHRTFLEGKALLPFTNPAGDQGDY